MHLFMENHGFSSFFSANLNSISSSSSSSSDVLGLGASKEGAFLLLSPSSKLLTSPKWKLLDGSEGGNITHEKDILVFINIWKQRRRSRVITFKNAHLWKMITEGLKWSHICSDVSSEWLHQITSQHLQKSNMTTTVICIPKTLWQTAEQNIPAYLSKYIECDLKQCVNSMWCEKKRLAGRRFSWKISDIYSQNYNKGHFMLGGVLHLLSMVCPPMSQMDHVPAGRVTQVLVVNYSSATGLLIFCSYQLVLMTKSHFGHQWFTNQPKLLDPQTQYAHSRWLSLCLEMNAYLTHNLNLCVLSQ